MQLLFSLLFRDVIIIRPVNLLGTKLRLGAVFLHLNVNQEELGGNSEFKNWLVSIHKLEFYLKWLNWNWTVTHLKKKNILIGHSFNIDQKTYQYCYYINNLS